MKTYVTISALIAAGVLSACNSSQIDKVVDLEKSVAAHDEVAVDVDDLPDNATMKGHISAVMMDGVNRESAAEDQKATVYLGDATADFDFENGSLSGTATNFNEYEVTYDEKSEELGSSEKTGSLDGSLDITGDITGTGFDYAASGVLSTETEELGTVIAEVELGGDGHIFSSDDKLTAEGDGEGYVDLTSSEEGYLGEFDLYNDILLQE